MQMKWKAGEWNLQIQDMMEMEIFQLSKEKQEKQCDYERLEKKALALKMALDWLKTWQGYIHEDTSPRKKVRRMENEKL